VFLLSSSNVSAEATSKISLSGTTVSLWPSSTSVTSLGLEISEICFM
jgi:hypothetical protein